MGTHSTQVNQGFTIIETMLVLAVTGLMIAGLLVGLGSSISNQRYLDSVSSFKSLLQDQYSQIDNVTNDRDNNWSCGVSATPVESQNGGIAPGQSDCVLLGRYVGVVGDKITMATVVGYPNTAATSTATIASVRDNYTLGISTSSIEQTSLEWGARIAWPKESDAEQVLSSARSLAVLMIRSPEDGTTYTFTSDTVNEIDSVSAATLKSMIVADLKATNPGQGPRTVCIDPDGFSVPENLALYIGAGASGSSSIEVRSRALLETPSGGTKC